MENETTWVMALTIVISLVLIIGAYMQGKNLSAGEILQTIRTAPPQALQIAEIVKAGVFAAEQLKTTGQLPDNNAAFDYAFRFAKSQLPDLTEEELETWIESFVPLVNQARNRLGGF